MTRQVRFVPEAALLVERGDFNGLRDMLKSKDWLRPGWLAVALWVSANGRWYVFDRQDFESMAGSFLGLSAIDQTEKTFQEIFDIHEYKSAEQTHSLAAPPKGGCSLLLQPNANPANEATAFAGAWVPMQVPAHVPPPIPPIRIPLLLNRGFESIELEDVQADTGPLEVGSDVQTRTPHLDFEPHAPESGKPFKVEVFADQTAFSTGEAGASVEVSLPQNQDSVDIDVWLCASNGLRIVGASVQRITLTRGQPRTTSATFEVGWVPRDQPGDTTEKGEQIMAVFNCQSRPCGWVTRAVLPGASASVPWGTLHAAHPAVTLPDMIVTVVCPEGDETHFQVAVECPSLAAYQTRQVLPWTLSSRSEDLMRAYVASFSTATMSNERRRNRLDGVGQELYRTAPAHFKLALAQLTAAKAGPLNLLVVSQEPYIPWELMMPPVAAGVTPMPLGAAHVVGRWVDPTGRPPDQHLSADASWVIAPDYMDAPSSVAHLPKQVAEADYVARITNGERLNPATVSQLEAKISGFPRPLIHFVGHGAIIDSQLSQALLMDDGDALTQLDLLGMRYLAEGVAKGHSLIFLNACQSGQPIRSLSGGSGGLAATFLGMGASAVIAPLWSVRDEIAFKISESFYAKLQSGVVQIGELLRQCRAHAYEGPSAGEDTFAAYCFYGDPCMTIELDVVQL